MSHSRNPSLDRLPGFLAMALPADAVPPRSRAAPARATEDENLLSLTRAVRAGDAAAFSRFYDLYSFGVYKHLLVLAKGDELAAREVFQTVVIKLAKKMVEFDDDRPLRAWLQRVARNAFIDHCRARRRDTRHVSMDEVVLPELAVDASRQQLNETLRLALADCSPEEREILHAIYVDGQSVAEVATQNGQTYKALESRLARLRQKVREQLLKNLRHE